MRAIPSDYGTLAGYCTERNSYCGESYPVASYFLDLATPADRYRDC